MESSRKTKYLKDSRLFTQSEEGSVKYKSFLDLGRNAGKAIFFKTPSCSDDPDANKSKFQNPWLSKKPVFPQEIICSEAYRIFLGDHSSPKYRVCVDADQSSITMSKLLLNFIPWAHMLNAMADLTTDEALVLDYRGDRKSVYGKISLKYLKTTSTLDNFNRMVAVCLLFGKDDLHSGNWGIVNLEGRKFAATVDHEKSLKVGFCIFDLIKKYGHRKEQFLTAKFIAACREILVDYESKKDMLKEVMSICINEIRAKISSVPSIEKVMEVLEHNKTLLSNLSYQIEAELAIIQGDCAALRGALWHLPSSYFPKDEDDSIGSPIISMQNYRDGHLNYRGMNLRGFIKVRNICDCDSLHFNFLNGKIKRSEGFEMSVEDISVENKLLAVYDEVEREKHNVPVCNARMTM